MPQGMAYQVGRELPEVQDIVVNCTTVLGARTAAGGEAPDGYETAAGRKTLLLHLHSLTDHVGVVDIFAADPVYFQVTPGQTHYGGSRQQHDRSYRVM
jgi:hypothetical protein